MSRQCECRAHHVLRKVVLTGGPGAGKTAALEMLRHSLCEHVAILPEAAGIIFGGGFPRGVSRASKCAVQRAIFHVQLELENVFEADGAGVMLCDRGAVDGFAYWPGEGDFWAECGASREAILRRYDAVIHLRVPDAAQGYGHQNPLRVESDVEARRIDDRILAAWDGHPRRVVIDAAADFMDKARRTLDAIRQELPPCCRTHATHAALALGADHHVRVP